MKRLGAMTATAICISLNVAQAELPGPIEPGIIVLQATQPNGTAGDCADAECGQWAVC
jgi:hypothetical protein